MKKVLILLLVICCVFVSCDVDPNSGSTIAPDSGSTTELANIFKELQKLGDKEYKEISIDDFNYVTSITLPEPPSLDKENILTSAAVNKIFKKTMNILSSAIPKSNNVVSKGVAFFKYVDKKGAEADIIELLDMNKYIFLNDYQIKTPNARLNVKKGTVIKIEHESRIYKNNKDITDELVNSSEIIDMLENTLMTDSEQAILIASVTKDTAPAFSMIIYGNKNDELIVGEIKFDEPVEECNKITFWGADFDSTPFIVQLSGSFGTYTIERSFNPVT